MTFVEVDNASMPRSNTQTCALVVLGCIYELEGKVIESTVYVQNGFLLHLTMKNLPNLGSNSWFSLPGSYPLAIRYCKRTNFRGHNISWVKVSRGFIFVGKSSPPLLLLLILHMYKLSWV